MSNYILKNKNDQDMLKIVTSQHFTYSLAKKRISFYLY